MESGPQWSPDFKQRMRVYSHIDPAFPILHLLLAASRNLTHFGSFWWFFTFHLSFLTNVLCSCVTALALLPVVDAQIARKRSSCCIPLCLELLSSEQIQDATHTGFRGILSTCQLHLASSLLTELPSSSRPIELRPYRLCTLARTKYTVFADYNIIFAKAHKKCNPRWALP